MLSVVIADGGLFVVFSDFPLKYYERLPGGRPINTKASQPKNWFFSGMYIGKNIQKLLRSLPFKEDGMVLDYEECTFEVKHHTKYALRLVRMTRKPATCGKLNANHIPQTYTMFNFKVVDSISVKRRVRKLVRQKTALLLSERTKRREALHAQKAIEAETQRSLEKESSPVQAHPENCSSQDTC